ncbi:s1 p1 nuclease [Pyrenophora seminiperda CCB06]|uniref:S1 p1 nuclease n=1 Tax=Pyrenophora seminiperda CCB06 TaxID=1302712 RepID=A0A3M7M9C1_9PLEO|nr:s1 p1 nuclease [Pyrenophora seminiperda CCB06]
MTVPKSLLTLLAAAPYASAWGSLGHTAVAYMAQNFVSNKTAKFAQGLLADDSSAYMANVATWADSYRSEKGGQFSAVYHYLDALDSPPESCNVDFERDCPEEGCIVSAIANYSSRAFQSSVGVTEQQKALKWIIHFIGDIHQPLHVENLDVGGNLINVTFNGVKTNLHSIWDTAIPQKAYGSFSQATALALATNLTAEVKHGKFAAESKQWLAGLKTTDAVNSSMVWARDTNSFVCSTVIPNGPDAVFAQELSGAYYNSVIPVVTKQLAKAGYRLAAWLDALVELNEKAALSQRAWERGPKRVVKLQPWQEQARQARREFGPDCGCGEDHSH